MRTAQEDAEVTELLRTYDRTVARLRELGVNIHQARPREVEVTVATQAALSVETVSSAHFWLSKSQALAGVVYDGSVGIEFDVREDRGMWNVNDDEGRDHRASDLKAALTLAINANAELESRDE